MVARFSRNLWQMTGLLWLGSSLAAVVAQGDAGPNWVPVPVASLRQLDLENGKGRAVHSLSEGEHQLEGCLRQDLPGESGSLVDARCEFFIPEDAPLWASSSLALLGSGDDERLYAMALLKDPGVDGSEIKVGFHSRQMVAKRLPRGTWAGMRVRLDGSALKMKAWTLSEAEPDAWDVTLSAGAVSWGVSGFGPRTYGHKGRFRNFRCSRAEAPPPRWRSAVPRPVFDEDPSLVELYDKAWELAWRHVKQKQGAPQSPYMDEACFEGSIFIWDTCFMALFCKYAPDVFPGVESLRNFYLPEFDGVKSSLHNHNPDNPPLFAWAEMENFRFTNDLGHLRELVQEKRYLQKYYEWFSKFDRNSYGRGCALKPHELGYYWCGWRCGMDNSPRGRTAPRAKGAGGPPSDPDPNTLWVDALAQQGLSALNLSRFHHALGDSGEAAKWEKEYLRLKELMNRHYWDEVDGMYYDIDARTRDFVKVRTPASYWPLLAEMADAKQAKRMAEHLRNPAWFGGTVPWVTLAREDPEFAADGNYWCGGIWLPTTYMGVKALEKYGFHDLADESAKKVLDHMNATFRNYQPATIWECYSPTRAEPSSEHGRRARPDFCGWSALGPISLFVENVLGFHEVDAARNTVRWRLCRESRHGIRHLRFGDVDADIMYETNGVVEVRSNKAFSLLINGARHSVVSGLNRFQGVRPVLR